MLKTSLDETINKPLYQLLRWDKSRGMCNETLLLVILMLLGSGLVICFSSYYYFSSQKQSNDISLYYFISRQLLWALFGLTAMIILMSVRLEFFYRVTPLLWFVTLILNILPLTGLFNSIRGGNRWITLGSISFQPSELAKLTLVLYMARVIYNKKVLESKKFYENIKISLMIASLCIPVYLQNNLSTAIFIFGISILVYFLAEAPLASIFLQIFLAAILGIFSILTTWRIERLYFFFNPEDNLTGGAMQADMAHKAFISGGLFGHGLGNGVYKLGRISLVHSDYIFATVGEELGLLGVLFVITLFIMLLWLAIRISRAYYYSEYEKLLLVSLSLIIVFQAFFHMAVVVGLLPVTGMPLPFFSAGGTSLAITLMICGIMLNISRRPL